MRSIRRFAMISIALIWMAVSIGLVGCGRDEDITHIAPEGVVASLSYIGQVEGNTIAIAEVRCAVGYTTNRWEGDYLWAGGCQTFFSGNVHTTQYDDVNYVNLRNGHVTINDTPFEFRPEHSHFDNSNFRTSYAVYCPEEESGFVPQPGDSLVWDAVVQEYDFDDEPYLQSFLLPEVVPVPLPEKGTVVAPWDAISFLDVVVPDSVSIHLFLYDNLQDAEPIGRTRLGRYGSNWPHLRIPSEVSADTLWVVARQHLFYGNFVDSWSPSFDSGGWYESTSYLIVDHSGAVSR